MISAISYVIATANPYTLLCAGYLAGVVAGQAARIFVSAWWGRRHG